MERKITVYGLVNSLNGEIFYVGQTKCPKRRLYEHQCLVKNIDNPQKYNYTKNLFEQNGNILMLELFSTIDQSIANQKETEYILKFPNLLNKISTQIPSRKGSKATKDTRKKMFDSSPLKKSVAMLDKDNNTIKIFEGVREAYRQTKIDHRSIAAVAGGSKIRKTAGGYKWQYIK